MNTPVYSSSSNDVSSDRHGWDALDHLVLAAVTRRPGRAAEQVLPRVPFRLVQVSLRILERRKLVTRRHIRVPVDPQAPLGRTVRRTVWEPAAAGHALSGTVAAGKAA